MDFSGSGLPRQWLRMPLAGFYIPNGQSPSIATKCMVVVCLDP